MSLASVWTVYPEAVVSGAAVMVDLLEQDLWSSVRVVDSFLKGCSGLLGIQLWMMEVTVEASVLWGTFRTQKYIFKTPDVISAPLP